MTLPVNTSDVNRELMLKLIVIATVLLVAVLFNFQLRSTSTQQRLTTEHNMANRQQQSKFDVQSHGRYLTNCRYYFEGRLGNHLFKLAALQYIANVTRRQVFLMQYANDDAMNFYFDRWFDVERYVAVIKRVRDDNNLTSLIGPYVDVSFTGRDSSFDENWVETLKNRSTHDGDLANVTTARLCGGYFVSWQYVEPISSILKQMLRPKPEVTKRVEEFFESVRPKNWIHYRRIGLHVRAGDFRASLNQNVGFTIPTQKYFERALHHVIYDHNYGNAEWGNKNNLQRQTRRFQVVVATNEFRWTAQHINVTQILANLEADHTWWSSDDKSHSRVNVEVDVVHSVAHDAGFDLVALSLCDEVVISTGTYGWWAGWLSRREVTYFKNWPRPGFNHLTNIFVKRNYFPPSWNGIEAPYFDFNVTKNFMGYRLDLYQKLLRDHRVS